MTITEKKPLLIRIPGEITPNELPITASAVGYDFVEGNYLIYATGSDSWVTAPPNSGPQYWQSDINNQIFTTGSIVVTGSITGSNLILDELASRILVPNGALVISSSAGTFITGSLIVSGTRSDTGTETTSVLFNGDIFVSGGIGINDYIQLKPVNLLRIPTNTTASYVYTSGSTNDLYFTQYNGPYTNTTRLRWLESVLTTGLLHGGILSTANGSTTFSMTSGSGLIVSFNASTTTDPYPTIQFLQWPAYTSQSLTYVSSSQISYIGINSSGGIIQRTTPFGAIDYETSIPIGRVLHQSGSVTNGTITSPHVSYGVPGSHDIFVRAFGPLKLSGHVLAASGSTLGLTKTGGDSYVEGRNYTSNPSSPDLVLSTTDFALTGSKIYKEYVSGSTPVIDTGVGAAGYTVIDPGLYNNNGTLASVASGQYTIQRVFWFPNSVNRALFVYYGTAVYNSIDVAQASIADEGFTEGANTAGAAILVGYVIVKGNATNLSNAVQAKIIQAPLFRAAGVGGGAAGGGTTTPGGLDTYVQFNDGGSTFGGVAGLTFNKVTNTLSTTNLAVSNIATVSGSVILGDAASDVVYISGSVTASNGLQVTGSINGSSTITATTGFSGSLTRLTDGTSYIIAGNNVSITTGSNGAVTVNAITSSNFFRLELLDYEALSSVISTTLGQVIFPANEYTGSLTLRGVISSNNATNTGSIQLYNVTSGAYVDIGGPGVKHLSVTGTIPTIIQSVNLISASGFSSSSQAIYELVASSSNALNTSFFGSFEIRPQGTFQLNGGSGGSPGGSSGQIQYNNGGSFGGVTNLTWDGATLNATGSFKGNLDGTASYATNAGNALTASFVQQAVSASFATVAVSLTSKVFNVALNGTANGVATNIGALYIPASTTVTTKSLAYIGGSIVSEVAVLKMVPINSVTVSASWVVTGTLTSVSLSSPATLGPGWYDLTLETGTVSQTAFGRGLYLTSGDI
jgi:hypothetical protein